MSKITTRDIQTRGCTTCKRTWTDLFADKDLPLFPAPRHSAVGKLVKEHIFERCPALKPQQRRSLKAQVAKHEERKAQTARQRAKKAAKKSEGGNTKRRPTTTSSRTRGQHTRNSQKAAQEAVASGRSAIIEAAVESSSYRKLRGGQMDAGSTQQYYKGLAGVDPSKYMPVRTAWGAWVGMA